jgi:hypothetical protein
MHPRNEDCAVRRGCRCDPGRCVGGRLGHEQKESEQTRGSANRLLETVTASDGVACCQQPVVLAVQAYDVAGVRSAALGEEGMVLYNILLYAS